MKKIHIRREHQLGNQGCLELADKITENLIKRIGGSKSVDGNTVNYKHVSGSKGQLVSSDTSLDIVVTLGFLVRSFGPSIEQEIQATCDKYLSEQKG